MNQPIRYLIDTARQHLDTAETRNVVTINERTQIEQRLDQLLDDMRTFADDAQDTLGNINLSEAGRKEALQEQYKRAHAGLSDHTNAIATTVRNIEERLQNAAVPKPPSVDSLELRLMNVRQDLRMSLDNLHGQQLVDRLTTLVEGGDAATKHLALGTPWVNLYLEGRQETAAASAWNAAKRRLMPLVLTERGANAYQALLEIEHLHKVVTLTTHAVGSFFLHTHPDEEPRANAWTDMLSVS